ncbi:hypothetical protein EKO27_g4637 [Xylaria grammica]|uniref:Uncharacterized protein n=1 Tax=Xylaria grammica TaxID=363999 RepID=A0A439D7V0_9PEZI|nr:hypothetical protein EKO27_g4637 [Xylaria grammica]
MEGRSNKRQRRNTNQQIDAHPIVVETGNLVTDDLVVDGLDADNFIAYYSDDHLLATSSHWECEQPYNRDAIVTEAGIGCNETCGCRGACGNRISRANLDDFFGGNVDGEPHRLGPCFVTQLQKMPDEAFERLTRENLFLWLKRELIPELAEYDKDIREWQEKWDELETTSSGRTENHLQLRDHRAELQRALLREAGDGGTGKASQIRCSFSWGAPGNRRPARGTARCVASAMTGENGTVQPVTSASMV